MCGDSHHRVTRVPEVKLTYFLLDLCVFVIIFLPLVVRLSLRRAKYEFVAILKMRTTTPITTTTVSYEFLFFPPSLSQSEKTAMLGISFHLENIFFLTPVVNKSHKKIV